MQLPFLNEGPTRLHALRSRFDLAALAAPETAAGIVRTGTGLCLARLQRVKKSIFATHAEYIALPPEAGPEEITAAVAERLEAWGGVEYAAYGLDYAATTVRSFRFPFGGQRQIKAVLPHEFSEHSPLSQQDYYLVQAAPGQDSDGKYTVPAAAVKREDITNLTKAFSERGVSLRTLSPAWYALPFAWKNAGGKDQNICFVEMDGTREAYVLMSGGAVRGALCLPHEGRGIDQLAGRIAFFINQTGPAERIVFTGSKCPDESRMRELEGTLGLPAEKLALPQNIDMSALGESQDRFIFAVALAGSLLMPQPETGINFLTGDLTPSATLPEWQATVRKIVLAACFVMASLCLMETAEGLREQSAIRPLRQELFRNYREALADVPSTPPIPQMERIMETRLRDWRMGPQTVETGGDSGTALDVLTALHRALAPKIEGAAESMTLSRDRFTLSGSVEDFKVADTIREKLAAQPLFLDVQLKNVQRGEQQKVLYEIEGKIRSADK